ncbi:MAG: HAMP domain-containing protein [Planctomycetes bacterium]|nr:HAMP domain-containing protein [Planctomycetota bacterium]
MLIGSYSLQQGWLEENRADYERQFHELTARFAYSDILDGQDPAAPDVVRRVLAPELRERFRSYFRDVLIRSGSTIRASVDLNPLGVLGRRTEFPLQEIREGIRVAMEDRQLVRAGGGFCVAIVVGDAVTGGAWFEPRLPPPPPLPFGVFAIPVVVGTLLFGLVTYVVLARGLMRPLRSFGELADRFGAGAYDLRVPEFEVAELEPVLRAFNSMADRIEGHHQELAREVRRATEEAQRRERAMLQSARLASMGTLAAGIAHEINNPIGGMRNALRRLEKIEGLDDKDRAYLELIRDGLDRVGRIARRVLDFSPRSDTARPFDVRDAIEGARALVDHRLRKQGVELTVDVEAGLPQLVGDRHEFQQVLLNLFLNSLDVLDGRPSGRIDVRAHRVADAIVHIVVKDDGPGMDPALLDRVVDPFFSAKGRPDASGLGLFISASIVRNHGGEMHFESALGAGFEVTIALPIERGGERDAAAGDRL